MMPRNLHQVPIHPKPGPWAPLNELEARAIRHSVYLDRLVTYDGGRRPVLQLSAEFLLEVSRCLRELVHAGRTAA
jgi:hypothetical protein